LLRLRLCPAAAGGLRWPVERLPPGVRRVEGGEWSAWSLEWRSHRPPQPAEALCRRRPPATTAYWSLENGIRVGLAASCLEMGGGMRRQQNEGH
jgi:hypothetical protein